MAVLGRTLFASSERVDLPDLLSIDSFTIGDFKYLIKSLVGDTKPYVLKGFEVVNPATSIGTQTISINVADSVVYFPASTSGPFYFGLPAGAPSSAPLIPELRKNATNYVYLTFTTFDTAQDNRAFWDPDKNGGVGGEFSQNVNTEEVISVDVGVSVSGFPDDTIPVCQVVVGPSVIASVEDCRDMLFRLGSGGQVPNPFNRYAWRDDPLSQYARKEPSNTMASPLDPDPFQGGDKNIQTLKEWMDAVMTKLLEISGTQYWYTDTSAYNMVNLFLDSMGSAFKSKGSWVTSTTTLGYVQWTEDIVYKRVSDPRDVIIRANNVTLANDQILYLDQIRDKDLNALDVSVNWINGSNVVNGQVAAFGNLNKGDWIKKKSDDTYMYLRVEEFYASQNLGGGATTPTLAQSVLLSANYLGTTENQFGIYTKGVYSTTDLSVANRNNSTMISEGGNLLWLADRSDTVMAVSGITTTSLACTISLASGTSAKVTTGAAHNLINGDRVTLVGGTQGYGGTYLVTVIDATNFTIETAVTGNDTCNGYYAVVTTTTSTNGHGLQLESANHGFQSDDYIQIENTGLGYDNATPYQISFRSATTFQVAVPSALAPATTGSATLSRILVRTEFGSARLVPGDQIVIGEAETANIRAYVGMTSESQTHPDYLVTSTNVLIGQDDYNSLVADSLTTRVSNLTAMMANKAQDKTIQMLPSGYERVVNTTSGANQDVTFVALLGGAPRLDVAMPRASATFNCGLFGTLQLGADQAAYFTVNRNANASVSDLTGLTITAISTVPVDENVFVFAYRLAGTDVWLWDGTKLSAGISASLTLDEQQRVVKQNRNLQLVSGGDWSWNSGTNTLTWASTAYVRLPGLVDSVNTITAASAVLPNANSVAYVTLNRQGAGGTLSVTVANADTLTDPTLTDDLFVIARRDGANVIVDKMLLINGESRILGAAMSEQTKTLLGTSVDQADSNPNYSGRGAPDRVVKDTDGALDAIANLDIQLDKWFGQLELKAVSVNSSRVIVTGADRILRDNTTISKQIQSLLLEFDGAQIDFATGNVYASDGVTALGINFTPATIAASQWRWYSVTLVPGTATSDNRLTGQLIVIPALTDGSTQNGAARAAFANGKKIGQVAVQESGGSIANIAEANIIQLNMDADAGGGVGLKNYIKNPQVDYALVNWSINGSGLTLTKTTAAAEVLGGAGSVKITGTPATIGSYVAADMNPIDYEDMGNLMYVYFTYLTEGSYSSGDFEVVLTDLTTATDTVIGTIAASTVPTFFQGTYQLSSTLSHTSYSFRIKAVNATSGSLVMDEVFVGPQIGVTAMPQTLVGNKTFQNNVTIDQALTLVPMTQGSVLFTGASGVVSQNNTQLFWDDTNHHLGIGNSAPLSFLHIGNAVPGLTGGTTPGYIVGLDDTFDPADGAMNALVNTGSFAQGKGGSLGFAGTYSGTSNVAMWARIDGKKENTSSGDYAGYLAFSTRHVGSNITEAVRITSQGLVGIGTTTPGSTLDVNGVVQLRNQVFMNGASISNSAATVVIGNTTQTYALQISSDGTLAGDGFLFRAATGQAVFTTNNAIPMYFCINGAHKGVLDAAGNWGFGTDTAVALITVGTTTTTPAGGINFGGDTDLYRNGVNSLKTDGAFTAASLSISGLTQGSVLFVNSSGNIAQDNAQFFWDDTNHRLGLGTASPAASSSLDIRAGGNQWTLFKGAGNQTPTINLVANAGNGIAMGVGTGSAFFQYSNTGAGLFFVTDSTAHISSGDNTGAAPWTTVARLSAAGGFNLGSGATDPGAGNMTIQGSLGVGNASPGYPLDVTGAGRISGDIHTGAAHYVNYGSNVHGSYTVVSSDYLIPVDTSIAPQTFISGVGATAAGSSIMTANWYGQTFTPSSAYTLNSVSWYANWTISGTYTAGTITIGVYVWTGTLGALVASGTINASSLTPIADAGFHEINVPMSVATPLNSGTTYIWVYHASGVTGTASGTVCNGGSTGAFFSSDSGTTWSGLGPVGWGYALYEPGSFSPTTVTLPTVAIGQKGRVLVIKDVGGDAANGGYISIAPNGTDKIDGSNSSFTLDVNYGSVTLICNGSDSWSIT